MNIIIAGAGEVGGYAADRLSEAGHNVTVIDVSSDRLRLLSERLDVRTLPGDCAHLETLLEAGVDHCDVMVAATQVDEINMLAGILAKQLGAKRLIVRAHHTANYSLANTPYAARLGIDELICPEHMTALEIARTLRNPGAIAIEEFGRGQVAMQRVRVLTAGEVGKKLREIQLPPNVRIATIEREAGAMIANADSVVEAQDVLTLFGETKRVESARKLFQKGKAKRKHVVVMGGTTTAVWVCRAMKSRIFSVRLFVGQHARAEELAAKLAHVTVLESDPLDPNSFAEEKIEEADAFIAATDDDEQNILACAHARQMGVPTTVVVVQRSTYTHLMSHVGITYAFSPRAVAVAAMMHLIDPDPVHSLAKFADDLAEVFRVSPVSKAAAIGFELRNIMMPPQTMIAALQRENEVFVPGAEDRIFAGDCVLVIGPGDQAGALRKLFVH